MSSFYGNGGYSSGGGGGSGEVISVNGKKGEVTLDAADVHALPEDTLIPSLDGFATEEWVQEQEYATEGEIPTHIVDGSTSGSVRGINTKLEDSSYKIGENAWAEGYNTMAKGSKSHAEGGSTVASGSGAHAEGASTVARGNDSHAEGGGSQATGAQSHAEGGGSQATGAQSHAEGGSTVASGSVSHAEGGNTQAIGISSHAEGIGTIAQGYCQHTSGTYNIPQGSKFQHKSSDYVVIVGNGAGADARSNAFAIKWDGTFVFADGTEITPAQFASLYNISNNISNYYTKSEIYNKTEVDSLIDNIDKSMEDALAEKADAASVSASAAQIAINTADISDLKENLTTVQSDALSPLLYNGFRKDGNGYYNADGNVVENASWQYCSDFIPVAPNTDYTCWGYTTYMANQKGSIVWYTIDKKIISRSFAYGTLTSPSNAYYAKVSIYNSGNYGMFITGTTNPIFYIPYSVKLYSDNDNAIEKSIENVSDALLPIGGTTLEYTDITVTEEAGYINKYGILESNNNWKHVEVDVEGGATYYFTGNSASQAYALHIFDAYHLIKTIPETLGTGTYAQTVVMPATAKRVIINKSSSGIVLKKATSLSLPTNTDWLNGKKLYCGGDSITEGANVGTLPNGYKKTYGGYTATRNSMTYASDGVGGSTMGKCTIDGTVHNNFIASRYKNIPTDADFITLWFGWNDTAYGWKSARDAYCVAQYGTYYSALTSAQQAEVDAYKTWRQWIDVYVGASDSTDITTWSGAWNTVLTWLLDNCPSAHIGVVIAYGMQDALVTSLISICEKFGVSYVKAYDPHEFFSVGHSTGIGVDQATKRKTLYTLDNTHPNELGYELMSTSFEQFIRRM